MGAPLQPPVMVLQEYPLVASLGIGALTGIFFYILFWHWTHPLRKYPGPFLAKFTNIYRLYRTVRGNYYNDLVEMHRKYGPVVRTAPNVLDIDYPEMIKTVFNIKGDWAKRPRQRPPVYNLFSELDKAKHAEEKKLVSKLYFPNAVLSLEPHMDTAITQLCSELETRFIDTKDHNDEPKEGKVLDLGDWISLYAWDVLGTVTFSRPFGYMSSGRDFDGSIARAQDAMFYFAWVGCLPWLDYVFDKNPFPFISNLLGQPGFSKTNSALSVQRLIDRYAGKDAEFLDTSTPDYLQKFMAIKQKDKSGKIRDENIVGWLMINTLAGADTTAIAIKTALYHCAKQPRVWRRLQRELQVAERGYGPWAETAKARTPPISYKTARAIPYLEAIVRESLRILPGIALPLERYVPPSGVHLPTRGTEKTKDFIPGNQGCILSFTPYTLNRHEAVFGSDSDQFRPERWLRDENNRESEEDFRERLQKMNNTDLSFGGGSRVCLGKHMGLMQAYKVLGTLAARYELDWVGEDGQDEWKVVQSWFPRQEGIKVRMRWCLPKGR
ncbi:unnamed protein product [Sordaria macrospora k-hell]|uniref:WGS project CABT00000000 data, contig 2.88 n=2 Tax=Sordaria macrospora TaxID=5147 RepID=F7WBY0_SORMK|nr:uncharacterized protein SMAC_09389 [Sordaria macrospora k-hell]CCC14510.1 unnamed protein product [Sordaria macrospora k-hell]